MGTECRRGGTPNCGEGLGANLPGRPLATPFGLALVSVVAPRRYCTSRPQVDLLAKQLEEEGERVLVVLPERYLRPCVPNSARSRRGKVWNLIVPHKYVRFRSSKPAEKKCPICAYLFVFLFVFDQQHHGASL